MPARKVSPPYPPAEMKALWRDIARQSTPRRRRATRGLYLLGAGAGLDGRWARRVRGTDIRGIDGVVLVRVGASRPREVLVLLTMPSLGSTFEEKQTYEDAYNERAGYCYRLHAGRIPTAQRGGRTPSLLSRSCRSSSRSRCATHVAAPLVELVIGKPPAGTMSVSAADLPLQQECIAGTTAHSISMSRRNAVEGVNGNLKSNFTNVDRGYARVFGTEKVAFFLAFTLAGLNALLARFHRRMVAAEKTLASAPKRRKKRRAGTFDEVLGAETDSSQAVDVARALNQGADAPEEAHPSEGTEPAGRAPP